MIKTTKHASMKINERKIDMVDIIGVVENPDYTEVDRFDSTLTHFIGCLRGSFLRVIGRWENRDELLIISAFFDRRIKRRKAGC